jgi:hypothetical protein
MFDGSRSLGPELKKPMLAVIGGFLCKALVPCMLLLPFRLLPGVSQGQFTTDGQSVGFGVELRLGLMTRCLLTDIYGPVLFVRPLREEVVSFFCQS